MSYVNVYFTVLDEHVDKTYQLLKHLKPTMDGGNINPLRKKLWLTKLDSLNVIGEFREQGIAFEADMEDEYSGEIIQVYDRYDDQGRHITKTICDSERYMCNESLKNLLDKPEDLKAAIETHLENIKEPSWDNQVENGKLYLMNELINI